MSSPWPEALARDGYAVVPKVLTDLEIDALRVRLQVQSGRGGRRGADEDLLVREIAGAGAGHVLAVQALGTGARPVRILFFDKNPDANWSVPYHQDLTIAVRERAEVEGFRPWTVKAGVPHVQAPAEVLQRMVAVRLHLDPCNSENGPLRVLPGTHLTGKLAHDEIETLIATREEVEVTADRGDAILMHPLLLHASSPARNPSHRRVLHIEYACVHLPPPLTWHL